MLFLHEASVIVGPYLRGRTVSKCCASSQMVDNALINLGTVPAIKPVFSPEGIWGVGGFMNKTTVLISTLMLLAVVLSFAVTTPAAYAVKKKNIWLPYKAYVEVIISKTDEMKNPRIVAASLR